MAGPISRWTTWFVALALVLVACGGSSDGTQQASPAPSASAPAQPTADADPGGASEGPVDDGQVHVVESGDTLSAIAQRFGTTVEAIVDANDIEDPDVIDVGDELVIPGGR